MDQWIIFILGIFVAIFTSVVASRVTTLVKERRRILVEEKTSTILAQTPDTAPGNLRLIYKGVRVRAFYDNVYIISNQAFEPVNQVDISLLVNPPNAFLDCKLVDRLRNRTCKIEHRGNEIKISAPYINSLRALDDKLELHVFTDQEMSITKVEGSGAGWKVAYRGNGRGIKGESVVSPTSGSYVCIEGPIGVGKSTLANLLKQKWSSKILFEEFENNPFLTDFYQDRGSYAFQTQIFFLLSRYSQLSGIEMEGLPLVADYMFSKDSIFAKLNLFGDELTTYMRGYQALNEHLPIPDLVIYLTADIDSLMERISKRGRGYEIEMKREYISELALLYEEFFSNYKDAPIYKIDTTNIDIVNNPKDQNDVLRLIEEALGHH